MECCVIQKEVDRQHDLTVYTVTGASAADEFIKAIEAFFSEAPTRLVLWDFSRADISRMASDDIRAVADIVRDKAERRAGGKTALLMPTDISFGLGRMFQAFLGSDDLPYEFTAFRGMPEARKWLGLEPPVSRADDGTTNQSRNA